MTKIITESGMKFGPFEDKYLYHIEQSDMVKSLQIKIVEFLVYHKKTLTFIEAKSSSPNPENKRLDNDEKFDVYIDNIISKFVNSVSLYISVYLKRLTDIIGTELEKINLSKANIRLLLVIKNHETKWLPPISDAIKVKLNAVCKIYSINPSNIIIMNEQMAISKGLIAE
jgi:hypothetical protein